MARKSNLSKEELERKERESSSRQLIEALDALEKEKRIKKEILLAAIEKALVRAYEKEYKTSENVSVSIDPVTGEITCKMLYDVVEEITNEETQILLSDAREMDERYEVGDQIEGEIDTRAFNASAMQTAKSIIMQAIRETEKQSIYNYFIKYRGQVMDGTVQRVNNGNVYVVLDNAEAILKEKEQIPFEEYKQGKRLTVYINDVRLVEEKNNDGKKKQNVNVQILVSRTHPQLVRKLFEQEVPEIANGIVEIKGLAREAGSRTKMAVSSNDSKVDPIGSCVGERGERVDNVVRALGGEKIDIIPWSEDPLDLIMNVLKPATVETVIILDQDEKQAKVVVPDTQLSLAIGKEGQNVRLAAKVSGWKIDIKSHSQYALEGGYDEDEE